MLKKRRRKKKSRFFFWYKLNRIVLKFHQLFFFQAYVLTNFTSISVSQNLQNVVVTYTSAVFSLSKVFLYLLTGKEFRTALRQRWRPTLTNVVNPC